MQPATRRRTAVEAVVEAANETETVETVNGRGAYVPPPLPAFNEENDNRVYAQAQRKASDALASVTASYTFAQVAGRVLTVVRVTRTDNGGFEGLSLDCLLSDGTKVRVSSTSAYLRAQFRETPDGVLNPPIVGRAVLVPPTRPNQQPAHSLE